MPGRRSWPTDQPDTDGGVSLTGAAAEVIIGKLSTIADQTAPRQAQPRIPWDACHPVWLPGQIPLAAGAGTLQQGNQLGPETPYWWDLRTISFWGFTAGTVTVYLNSTNGEPLAIASSVGQFTWGAQELLGPQDNLIFVASGVTGVVNLTVRAIEVAAEWLPEYLM